MIKIDDTTELEQLEKDAMDSVEAQFQIGMRYTCGIVEPRDYEEAFTWLKIAAENNHPYAQFRLGMAYLIRLGVDRDLFEAAIWFSASAAQGVDAAVPALQLVRQERMKLRRDASQHCAPPTGAASPYNW